ncbi:MAG TPA: hypothetical protein VMV57_01005 [Terracidiphilus sp.]|nr:hypothetical protein [Terracidiphilus sp.]
MKYPFAEAPAARRVWIPALLLALAAVLIPAAGAQATPAPKAPASPTAKDAPKTPTQITPEQAKQLFGLVDQLLQFSSQETGLPIKSEVKRRLTTREAVESYLREKFNDDQDARRMQRSEIVLKKFGLLDRDFDLKPFLLALLKEQIEAYYDTKTKTVNMLNWVSPDEQKPVLAHELTHALQDQHVDLTKWSDQTPPDVSTNSADDTAHIAKDELDTAREAVTEGQATAVMMDNMLKPMGRSLIKDPEVVELIKQQMKGSADSPILARAPLLLSESLLFPYREGLSFEQDIWMDKGQKAAFAGTLDRPPTSTWEIINPREYEQGHMPSVPLLPNIHPLVDTLYRPYDIGQVGELDVQILTGLFGGEDAARDLTPAWDGGIYWAGQMRSATPAQQASTGSIALFYLSVWRSATSATDFARLYASNLGNKYSGLKLNTAAAATAPANGDVEKVYSTSEGPVVLTTRGKMAFVSESFPLPLARKLTQLVLDAQGTGAMQLASRSGPAPPAVSPAQLVRSGAAAQEAAWAPQPLTASFVRFFANCGVMKAAVEAGLRAAH